MSRYVVREPNESGLGRCVQGFGTRTIRRQYLYIMFLALIDIENDLIGVVHIARKQGSHELGGVVGF